MASSSRPPRLRGPGAPDRIAPAFRIEKGGKGRAEVDVRTLRFVNPTSPAERAFNVAVDELSADIEQPEKDDPQADKYSDHWSMRLAYASPRLISAHADRHSHTGGVHPNSYTANINVDAAQGREATFEGLTDKAVAQKIFALCLEQVRDQKKEKDGPEADPDADGPQPLAKEVADASADLKGWSFGADAATIGYDPYVVGSYADGEFERKISSAVLRPLARPDFPLPR